MSPSPPLTRRAVALAAHLLRRLDSLARFTSGALTPAPSRAPACSTVEAGENCQSRLVSLEGAVSNINLYSLNTIGSLSMIDRDGASLAAWQDHVNVYPSTLIVYESD